MDGGIIIDTFCFRIEGNFGVVVILVVCAFRGGVFFRLVLQCSSSGLELTITVQASLELSLASNFSNAGITAMSYHS